MICKNVFDASVSLMSASIENKVRRFIQFSSMARYGHNEVPFREEYVPRPQDPYGIAKASAETVLKNLSEIHGMEYVIVVPHDVIGTKQKYDDPFRNVASIMVNLMLQKRQPIIYGTGEQMRCFSDVRDCIQALEKLVDADNVVGEVINIGPDEEFITVNTLAKTIAELMDFDLKPQYVAARPQEVPKAYCSSDKVRKLLGYKTKYTLKESLSEIINYITSRGPRPFEYHIDLEIINEKTPKTWKERLF
jgi:UDP-glucose 4-epimerase